MEALSFGGTMSKQSIARDVSIATAHALTEDLHGLVREEEVSDLRVLLEETIRVAIEAGLMLLECEYRRRLRPSVN